MHDLLNALFVANNVGDVIGWSRPALTDSGFPENHGKPTGSARMCAHWAAACLVGVEYDSRVGTAGVPN